MQKFHQNIHKKCRSAEEIRVGGREFVKGNSASIKIDQETRSQRAAHFLRPDLPMHCEYHVDPEKDGICR